MKPNPETPSSAAWLGSLLQVTDSAYPTGTFAHSGGLEGMSQLELIETPEQLEAFVESYVLHNLEQVELPLIHHACQAALDLDGDRVERLDELSSALRTPEEQRLAAARTGRQRLELLSSVLHLDESQPEMWSRLVPRLHSTQSPVVAGLEAAALGMPVAAAMQAYGFAAISAVVSAALKILRLGQTRVQEILHRQSAALPDLVTRAMNLREEEIGAFTPLLDIASARHKRAFSRLFLS